MAKKHRGKSSGIGGQAVLEGVMMKNKEKYAIAVRKPNQEIEVTTEEFSSVAPAKSLTQIPFVRGVFNFVDSLVLGMKSLTWSASFFEEEEETGQSEPKLLDRLFGEKAESVVMGCTVALSIVMAVAIFMVLPYFIASLLSRFVMSDGLLALLEGLIRLLIFIGYVVAISVMKDIRRVYMYHGAEHKCINCIERGYQLNVKNVKRCSKQHKRCGTSFMLFVMLVSIVLFMIIRVDSPVLRVVYRILLIPVIAGISYEIIRLAGRSNNILVRIISAPGMWLQRLTTREPDDDMIEVAIASVEAVFDWKAYYTEHYGYSEEPEEEGQEIQTAHEVS